MDEVTYQKWLKRQATVGIINYKICRTARKTHFCEKCGAEIRKGDTIWWYKPYPIREQWFKWKPRCTSHEPTRYNPETFKECVSEYSFEDNGFGMY